MNGFPSFHNIMIWDESRSVFVESWEKIITLKAKTIYPVHGNPFSYKQLEANIRYAKNMKIISVK